MIVIDFPDTYLQIDQPERVIFATELDQVLPALKEVEQAWKNGYYAVGYLSYEAAPAFDPKLQVSQQAKIPYLWFALFQEPSPPLHLSSDHFQVSSWHPDCTDEQYQQAITSIHEAISRGDTYQVNHTIRLHAEFQGDAFAYYQQLSQLQQGYNAYLDLGRYQLLSLSPELFFHWQDWKLLTRPMKGTAKRGRDQAEDQQQANCLQNSIKDRAENLMIVDLLRNDLSKLATIGSVQVPALFTVEKYPTIWQMTSTIEAIPRPQTTLTDIFQALFPCGSITGAPKRKTMELIADLEQSPREAYCGTIGYLKPDGEAVFNVAIRTVMIDQAIGQAQYGVGGGITWDSTSEGEYAEVLAKAQILQTKPKQFQLLESIRLENGNYTLLDRHLQRLKDSAAYFGFPLPVRDVKRQLASLAMEYPTGIYKVRLLLSHEGEIVVEADKLLEIAEPACVALAATPISSKEIFLYHKTTNRQVYDRQRIEGVFDTLLWNERGEITEFTIGNVVLELAGKRLTPPKDSGLLAGTLRAQLLEQGEIEEQVLTKEDLQRASAIWLINSVRGWVPVKLQTPALG